MATATDIATPADETTGARGRRLLAPIAAFCVPILAIVLAWPVADISFNDDWSYAWTAKQLAETGRFHYSGFAEPMIGIQAIWGAAAIRLFGFSFNVLRFSMLPWAGATSLLCYMLARRFGLTRERALLAALCVMLSPLALPLCATFMTDVPALCLMLACVYFAERSIAMTCAWRALVLLAIATVFGLLAGTIRQVMWLAPMVSIVWAMARRGDRSFSRMLQWAMLIVAGIACAYLMHWLGQQPYVPDPPGFHVRPETLARTFPQNALRYALTALAALLPLSMWLFVALPTRWTIKAFVIVISAIGFAAYWHIAIRPEVFPWMGNVMTEFGVLAPWTVMLGAAPIVIPAPVRFIVAVLNIATLLLLLVNAKPRWLRLARSPAVVVSVGYLVVIIWRVSLNLPMDRYAIPILPVLAIGIVSLGYRASHRHIVFVWACIAAMAVYSIVVTHDAFAQRRAIVRATETMLSDSVARRNISGGLEFDAWTQLNFGRYINTPGLNRPDGAFRVRAKRFYGTGLEYYYGTFLPSVEPRYFIFLSPQRGLVDSKYPRVPYHCWMPPHERSLVIQTGELMSERPE